MPIDNQLVYIIFARISQIRATSDSDVYIYIGETSDSVNFTSIATPSLIKETIPKVDIFRAKTIIKQEVEKYPTFVNTQDYHIIKSLEELNEYRS